MLSNKIMFDDSSKCSDESGTSGSSLRPSDCDASNTDLSAEDSDAVSNRNVITKTNSTKGNRKEQVKVSLSKKSMVTNRTGTKTLDNGKSSKPSIVKRPSVRLKSDINIKSKGILKKASDQGKHDDSQLNPKDLSVSTSYTLPPKRRQIDKKIIGQGCELLKQGLSCRIVAEKLNVPVHIARYWHRQYLTVEDREMSKETPDAKKLKRQIEATKYHSRETITEVCKLLKQGVSMREISREFGISTVAISCWKNNYIPKEELPPDSKLSEEQMSQACELLKQGNTAKSVAERFGVTVATVNCWKLKFVPESEVSFKNSHLFDNSKILEACRLMNQGNSLEAVSQKMGVKYKTVGRWKLKYLSERQDKAEGHWSGYIMLEACQLLRQGATAETVAKDLSVSVNLVRKWKMEKRVKSLFNVKSVCHKNTNDVKLKSKCFVVLSRDPKIEELLLRKGQIDFQAESESKKFFISKSHWQNQRVHVICQEQERLFHYAKFIFETRPSC